MTERLTPVERYQLLELVDRRFGIRGSDYGASRVDAAVERVLPTSGCSSAKELLTSVEDNNKSPRWLFELVEWMTVGETYFLRDPAQISALRGTVLPDILHRRSSERTLRLWSAGCSTGEEVYTLTILLKERGLPSDWEVTLLGTDVNRESLKIAREAAYPAWSFRATPTELRDRYFQEVANGWRLNEPLRRMARFAWANLGAVPLLAPVADADLIMCRNVTIYFDDSATQRLYRALVAALAPGGWLMLGPSDPLPADRDALERVEVAEAVVWRRLGAKPLVKESPRRVTPLGVRHVRRPSSRVRPHEAPVRGDELEAGLLALESGDAPLALDWLRRATFRDPSSAMAQFALARAYVATGDRPRAHAALLHTRRLLAPLSSDELAPGSDSVSVETLRQTVRTYLEEVVA